MVLSVSLAYPHDQMVDGELQFAAQHHESVLYHKY